MNQVTSFGEAISHSFTAFFAFLPALLGAILLLVLGWFISGLVGQLIEKALRAIGFERAVAETGLGDFLRRSGSRSTGSHIVGQLSKWFLFLIFVQAAANILQMPQVTAIINSIVLFIPRIIVALAIVVVGALLGKFLAGVVCGSVSKLGAGNPNMLAMLTNYAVIGFAVIAALNQLGIATVVVNTLFIGLVASVALAVGLAFGLGGRDVASEMTRSWYERGKEMADRAPGSPDEIPRSDLGRRRIA
jgi:hypothetical protein